MKKIGKYIIAILWISFLVLLIIGASFIGTSFTSAQTKEKTQHKTVVFVANSAWTIKFKIDSLVRVDPAFKVRIIESQSVSTSIQTRNNGGSYNDTYRDIKGDIICVMEK